MREIIALLTFFATSAYAVRLAVKKQIGTGLAAILLAFSLASGLAIANYDILHRAKGGVEELEQFRKQVEQIKTDAIGEIRKEMEECKASIDSSGSASMEAQEKADGLAKDTEARAASAKSAEESAMAVEQRVKELLERAEQARTAVVAVHEASDQLALLLTKVMWLQFEAEQAYGSDRGSAAVAKVMDGLDDIVNIVIPDPRARAEFVDSVKGSLPPSQ